MKYPYLIGERSPARAAEEFVALQYDSEILDLRKSFQDFLERFYPDVFASFWRIWELKIFFMRWPNRQSSFVIAIINDRSDTIVGLYPTFRKAARALRAICKLAFLHDSPF